MNTENTAPSFPPVDEKESCCSNTSCCGPQSPVTRLTPKVGRNDPCPSVIVAVNIKNAAGSNKAKWLNRESN